MILKGVGGDEKSDPHPIFKLKQLALRFSHTLSLSLSLLYPLFTWLKGGVDKVVGCRKRRLKRRGQKQNQQKLNAYEKCPGKEMALRSPPRGKAAIFLAYFS